MKNLKKIALVVTSVALVAAVSIGGTLAYLQASAKNEQTFYMGNVTVSLTDEHAKKTPKLVPGQLNKSEPIVSLGAGSSPCYVRAKIDFDTSNVELSDLGDGWTQKDDGYYYFANVLNTENSATPAIFTEFKIREDVVEGAKINGKVIINVEAIQSEGFDDADAAWVAFIVR